MLLEKVARRVNDDDVMHLLKLILKASGKLGVPQGGVISPLLSNLYLNEVDRMLERAKEVTRNGRWTSVEYARFADDLVGNLKPSCRLADELPFTLFLQADGLRRRNRWRTSGCRRTTSSGSCTWSANPREG